jgi:transcriptional regulator with XRE-family HTH domain
MKNLIRRRRQDMGISQVRLATLTGIANGVISDFELGKRLPWPRARKALARALGTTEAELFPEKGGKEW